MSLKPWRRPGPRLMLAPLALALVAMRAACAATTADTGLTVELTCGSALPLSAPASVALADKALTTVQSSEYNSFSPRWQFPATELQAEYQRALSGNHLRVIFDQLRATESRSGPLRIREILIRLSPDPPRTLFPDHFVDAVLALGGDGQIVGFALYSGLKVHELYRAVAQATGDEDPCHLHAYQGTLGPDGTPNTPVPGHTD